MRKVECRVVCRRARAHPVAPPTKCGRTGGGLSVNSPAGHGLHRSFSPPRGTKERITTTARRRGDAGFLSGDAAWRPEKQKRGRSPRNETQPLRVFASLRFNAYRSPLDMGSIARFVTRSAAGQDCPAIPCVNQQDSTRGWRGRSPACAARRSAHPPCRSSARSGWRRHGRPDSGRPRAACRPVASPRRSRRPSPC
jgi:hypothetical protein